jgi:hypothetical protein
MRTMSGHYRDKFGKVLEKLITNYLIIGNTRWPFSIFHGLAQNDPMVIERKFNAMVCGMLNYMIVNK